MKMQDITGKSVSELNELLASTRADLLEAQRGLSAGELANPRIIREHRTTIARILTVMKSKSNQAEEA